MNKLTNKSGQTVGLIETRMAGWNVGLYCGGLVTGAPTVGTGTGGDVVRPTSGR